jgi:hypothetical protein
MKIIIFYTACTNMLRLPQKPYSSRPHHLHAMPPNPPLAILLFIPQCHALVNFIPPVRDSELGLWVLPHISDPTLALRGRQQK